MARYVAFLRAVNVGGRTVSMDAARRVLENLEFTDVSSFVNSGNLLYSGSGRTADHEAIIREHLEKEFGFEVTTFVRTAAQVTALGSDRPFGSIADEHTHFVLLPLTRLTAAEKKAVTALSNDHDEVIVKGRDVHWLIRSKSTETTLGPKKWKDALPGNPTTARNTTMMRRLITKL